jgi:hypothetical protein
MSSTLRLAFASCALLAVTATPALAQSCGTDRGSYRQAPSRVFDQAPRRYQQDQTPRRSRWDRTPRQTVQQHRQAPRSQVGFGTLVVDADHPDLLACVEGAVDQARNSRRRAGTRPGSYQTRLREGKALVLFAYDRGCSEFTYVVVKKVCGELYVSGDCHGWTRLADGRQQNTRFNLAGECFTLTLSNPRDVCPTTRQAVGFGITLH